MGEQKKLLVLCCHGVYHKREFYAEHPYEADFYKEHIRESFNALKEGRYDMLIISGGYTKYPVEKSEARGYIDWADDLGLARTGLVILEEYARSSVENLLYSMCRFHQYFKYFPEEVGACTLCWKKEWFEQDIAPALCLPNFHAQAPQGEEEKLRKNWERPSEYPDPHGVVKKHRDDPLEICEPEKVKRRDFWKKRHPYADINDVFRNMFKKLDEMKRTKNCNVDEIKPLYPWKQEP